MTGSLISWDDAIDEKAASNLQKAQENLRNLDTTPGELELSEQAKTLIERKQLAGINALNTNQQQSAKVHLQPLTIDMSKNGDIIQRALDAINQFKDDFEVGARIEAKQKRLINSQMDANQLVPFKYSWAWSMYLESTEAHWMPAEANAFLADINRWKIEKQLAHEGIGPSDIPEHQTFKASEKKIIYRLCANYIYNAVLYNPSMLVNLYRHMTSPECRQYVLRQCFEEQAFHHAIRHIVESFDLTSENLKTLAMDEDIFRTRNRNLLPHIEMLNDMNITTESNENIGKFIVALAVIYGGLKPLYHLVPLFQTVKLSKYYDKLNGPGKLAEWILRDINRQYDFGIRLINGILEENPGVFTASHQHAVVLALKQLHIANLDFLSTNIVDETDLAECGYASSWLMSHFCRSIGIVDQVESPAPDPKKEWFIDYFLGLNGHKDHGTAKVSLTKSESQGSLDWG